MIHSKRCKGTTGPEMAVLDGPPTERGSPLEGKAFWWWVVVEGEVEWDDVKVKEGSRS